MDIRDILFEVGRLLGSRYQETQKHTEKERFHLVSEVDVEVEQLLIERLRSTYTDDAIFSEESGYSDGSSNSQWIIDPIDGTANFIAGVPYFAISIARETEGDIVEGHIYNPVSEEYYHSTKSLGKSFLNHKPISVSETEDIRKALMAFGFSANNLWC